MKLYMVKLHLPHNEKAWIQVYAVSSSRARSHLSPLLCDIARWDGYDETSSTTFSRSWNTTTALFPSPPTHPSLSAPTSSREDTAMTTGFGVGVWTSGKYKLTVRYEEYADNPRQMYDHLGHMVCWSRDYRLGDDQPTGDRQEWALNFASELEPTFDHTNDYWYVRSLDDCLQRACNIINAKTYIMPLYLRGQADGMFAGGLGVTLDDLTDGGCGFIYVTKDGVRSEWKVKRITPRIEIWSTPTSTPR
jgi:hypothetical protein